MQFTAVLFVPKTSFELLGLMKAEPGVDLYSKKILIQKGSKDIMPEYLRFVKGVIDSEEIPLNISRETIQNNVRIDKIKKHVLKKLLEHLEGLKAKNREQYLNIWKNFSKNFKEGAVSDYDNREKLSQLLLFASSKTPADQLTDLRGIRRAHARGAEGDLLPGRQRPPDNRKKPGPGDLPQEGLRSPLPARSPGRIRPRPFA